MTRTRMTFALLALSIGGLLGLGSAALTSPDAAPSPPAPHYPASAIRRAQAYADWCGGKVQLLPGGPYVIDCDR